MGPWQFVPPWCMWFDNSMVSNEATMLEWSRETCMWICTWSIKRKTYRVNIPYPKCLIPEALWISDLGYLHIHSISQRREPVMSKHKIHSYCMYCFWHVTIRIFLYYFFTWTVFCGYFFLLVVILFCCWKWWHLLFVLFCLFGLVLGLFRVFFFWCELFWLWHHTDTRKAPNSGVLDCLFLDCFDWGAGSISCHAYIHLH